MIMITVIICLVIVIMSVGYHSRFLHSALLNIFINFHNFHLSYYLHLTKRMEDKHFILYFLCAISSCYHSIQYTWKQIRIFLSLNFHMLFSILRLSCHVWGLVALTIVSFCFENSRGIYRWWSRRLLTLLLLLDPCTILLNISISFININTRIHMCTMLFRYNIIHAHMKMLSSFIFILLSYINIT